MYRVTKYEQHLMDAIGFDAGDLAINQAGTFSETQRRKLENWWTFWTLGITIALSGVAGTGALLFLIIMLNSSGVGG